MKLNAPLITDFTFEGQLYNIDLSFDVVLDVLSHFEDEKLTLGDCISLCVSTLVGENECDVNLFELWAFIYCEFIAFQGEQVVEVDLAGNPVPKRKEEEYMDLEQDADFIYASFLQAYGINLLKEHGRLSWIEFRALLRGLPQDTIMQQIIQIRQWTPYKGVSKEERQRMIELQKHYSLRKEEADG